MKQTEWTIANLLPDMPTSKYQGELHPQDFTHDLIVGLRYPPAMQLT